MNEHIKTILQQQQEYEYLKNSPSIRQFPDIVFCSPKLTDEILPYMKKIYRTKIKRQKKRKYISTAVLLVFIIYRSIYVLLFILVFLFLISYGTR